VIEEIDSLEHRLVHLNGAGEVCLDGGPNIKHLRLLDVHPKGVSVWIVTSPTLLGVEVDSYALLTQIIFRPGQLVAIEKDSGSSGFFARVGFPALSNNCPLLCTGSNCDLTRVSILQQHWQVRVSSHRTGRS
jgi:hypothetical protein